MTMPKPSKTQRLHVFMNGSAVGKLERERTDALSFTYDQEWLESALPIPISHQFPLRERPYLGLPVRYYFDNLLPDDHRVRERIAAQAQVGGTQSFDILAALGRDCVGALQFYPEGERPGPVKPVKGKVISETKIADMLRNLRVNPLGISRETDFRISLAGVQSKTALLRMGNKWLLPEGPTPTTHILKPAIGVVPEGPDLSLSVENEWLCLEILKAYGLEAAQAHITEFDGIKVLVVERFDRKWTGKKLYRLPQEDVCQALGYSPDAKYESEGGPGIGKILTLLNESDQRDQDRMVFMKTQLIFWLISAIDGHAKNFSLSIGPAGFALAPLYDVLSADPHINPKTLPKQKLKLAMSVGNSRHYKMNEITLKHWQQTATFCKFTGLENIIEDLIANTSTVIRTVNDSLPSKFPQLVSEKIFNGMNERIKKLAR